MSEREKSGERERERSEWQHKTYVKNGRGKLIVYAAAEAEAEAKTQAETETETETETERAVQAPSAIEMELLGQFVTLLGCVWLCRGSVVESSISMLILFWFSRRLLFCH